MTGFSKADVRNVRAGGRSDVCYMAESGRRLTVNMQAAAYLRDENEEYRL